MNENENAIVTTKNEEESAVTVNKKSAVDTVIDMAVGAVAAWVTITLVGKAKKAWNKRKTKKQIIEADCEVVEEDYEEEDSDEEDCDD